MKTNPIEEILQLPPFSLNAEQKKTLFRQSMEKAFIHHQKNNPKFKRLCEASGMEAGVLDPDPGRWPYVPVGLFKHARLASVPDDRIKFQIQSSATSGNPSTIVVDELTARRQSQASARIIAEYIGSHRRPFLILDQEPAAGGQAAIQARSAATRGILLFANSAEYFLRAQQGRISLDHSRMAERLRQFERSQYEVCLFGFTYIFYMNLIQAFKDLGLSFKLGPAARVIHIGGWKNLTEHRVGPDRFLSDIHEVLGIPDERVFDVYGFTEQMGLVYINQGTGLKTMPVYSEIIIRDPQSLLPITDGNAGLVQILSPLPHSYPGISVLTEDVGRVTSNRTDEQNRQGTCFELLGRAPSSELRGCGDILGRMMES
jgi:phenylacetate-coenzyme A ligase PaaK-like adenylate-forming protein